MHETGCSGLGHWDDPEGWDGEGGGRGVQDGEHMYTCGIHDSLVFIPIPKKGSVKECSNHAQLHSSHTLAK